MDFGNAPKLAAVIGPPPVSRADVTAHAGSVAVIGLGLLAAAALSALLIHPTATVIDGQSVYPMWTGVGAALVQFGTLVAKALIFCWVWVWVRWSLPRFRYDQVMSLGWKILLNVALVNLLITAIVAKLLQGGR